MKTKLFLFVSFMTVFIAINACSKEAIEDCLYGSGMGCMEVPIIPTEDGKLDENIVVTDSTVAVAKLSVLD